MIMKHNVILSLAAIAAATLFCSCNKVQSSYVGPVELTVALSLPTHSAQIETKTAGDQSVNDVTIKTMQIFVFDHGTGQLDNCRREEFSPAATNTATLTATLTCTQGTKDLWAVVNWPEDLTVAGAEVNSIAALKAKTAALSSNAVDALIMTGSKENVNFATPAVSETVPVSRLCAAVVVKSVINDMLVPAYRTRVSIIGAYLMNVPAVQRVDGTVLASDDTASPLSSWMAVYSRPTSVLLNESFSAVSIPYGSPAHTTPHTFYTYANNYNETPGDGTGKSSTYLKVVLDVDGTVYYYPVILPTLERNKKYEVTLTVNHLGQTDPIDHNPVSSAVLTPSVSVSSWTTIPIAETI